MNKNLKYTFIVMVLFLSVLCKGNAFAYNQNYPTEHNYSIASTFFGAARNLQASLISSVKNKLLDFLGFIDTPPTVAEPVLVTELPPTDPQSTYAIITTGSPSSPPVYVTNNYITNNYTTVKRAGGGAYSGLERAISRSNNTQENAIEALQMSVDALSSIEVPLTASTTEWSIAYANRIVSASTPLLISSNAISISLASSTSNGYLSSVDWSNFNNKEGNILASTTLTYFRGDKTFHPLNTSVVTEDSNLYFNNARAITSTLTGYVSGAGTVSSSDSILTAIQKLNGNTSVLVTGVSSVSNSNGSLTISPTTGAVVASLNLGNANTWTGRQTLKATLSAGTTTTGTSPLKFTSGTSMTTAEAGAMEFTTDDLFFTITTSAARKRLLMADPIGGLISTRIPYATTNGRLTDSSNLTFNGTNLSLSGDLNLNGNYINSGTQPGNSTFIGGNAGNNATYASFSNFLGYYAGNDAADATRSNFSGYYAGNGAYNSSYSNYIGNYAGNEASNASYSNFSGNYAGNNASNASYSNFSGNYAGNNATYASYSNFLGYYAGNGSLNAAYSIFIGTNAGNVNNGTDSTFQNNLIIDQAMLGSGPRTSATDIQNNALLYGTFSSSASGQQLTVNGQLNAVAGGATYAINTTGSVKLSSLTGYTAGDTALCVNASNEVTSVGGDTCSVSSARFKHNIETLDTLDGVDFVNSLRPVSFEYNSNDKKSLGFIAEEVNILDPRLIFYELDGVTPRGINYERFTPIFAKAIQQLSEMGTYLADKIVSIKEATIGVLYIGDKICADDVCVTKEQFKQILLKFGETSNTSNTDNTSPEEDETIDSDLESDESVVEEPAPEPALETVIEPESDTASELENVQEEVIL